MFNNRFTISFYAKMDSDNSDQGTVWSYASNKVQLQQSAGEGETFYESIKRCRAKGQEMSPIHSDKVNNKVKTMFGENSCNCLWIGASDARFPSSDPNTGIGEGKPFANIDGSDQKYSNFYGQTDNIDISHTG